MRYLSSTFTGTGATPVFVVERAYLGCGLLTEVFLALVDLGSSAGVYRLQTVNAAGDGWLDFPGDVDLSVAGDVSFVLSLPPGSYRLVATTEETGNAAIAVDGADVTVGVPSPI